MSYVCYAEVTLSIQWPLWNVYILVSIYPKHYATNLGVFTFLVLIHNLNIRDFHLLYLRHYFTF